MKKIYFCFFLYAWNYFFVDLDKSLYYSRRYHKRKHFLLQIWCFSSAKELSLCHKLWFSNLYIFATQCHRPRYFNLWILLGQMISEAQLGLLLWGAIYYFVRVKGVGKGGFPPFSKIFQKQKCFFKGLKSKKGFFNLLHADLTVFNSNRFFCSCVFTKFKLPTAVKWMIWVNS